MRLRPRQALMPAVSGLLLSGVAVRLTVLAGDAGSGRWRLAGSIGLAWVAFALGAWGVRRLTGRTATALIVGGGIALQVIALSSPPRLTDDFFRYAWDGRVQAAGISPYRFTPTDDALADLRTPWLFPTECADRTPVCTRLNHPTSPTIYPPVAQAEFTAVHLLTRPLGPDGGRERTWQLLAAALATATTLALIRLLRRRGDPRQAVLWAWCPTVVLETGGNAHVDVLASLLVVLALTAVTDGRRVRGGVLIGLAIATKLLPVLLLVPLAAARSADTGMRPMAILRRRLRAPGTVVIVALTTLAATYLPHLVTVGTRVLGFLPGYLPEEGFDGRTRFPLLHPVFPGPSSVVAGVLALVAIAGWVLVRSTPDRPWTGAMILVGLAFALVGISYPWYALLLVPLVALDGRAPWLALAAAAYPAYLAPSLGWSVSVTAAITYGIALAWLAWSSRFSRSSRSSSRPAAIRR
ncbi:MAG: DUF2029 domain-containing protein [Kineosporiaceae bacterium]|nr:DUF2029 domain-containing protein [Kineosporiaceae bacterium]MBK7621977.1 DUF2029 domain-containing protein [Kineosporiaceae bacterium]MBK8074289.1 DUF2029 domain-containing protein [Kineosporiaceae bacterium]